MHLIKEIFKEIKSLGRIEELKRLPTIPERYQLIDQAVMKANISKTLLSNFSSDEQLYLTHLFQEEGVDLGLCPHFYIFFSKRNQKFHHVCKATEGRKRTYCKGDAKKCDKGLF
ncbi:MAG: hypothetical protein COS26_00075 [Candidatus Nealsonbacteria bacterium CG02_land_8_20_14_3_00_40_11]|uniref:Uncharacterized protein n=1 Tax=Candidatus Nealsonbacteria bacterium CG02_land_8_20_14_3_00_40_11 TaxID=1974700 RepID=A0A2M7D8T6_9BACT|nr:MAG: hypothetical protein COS26_00075 [Candidatus Nealsonbacteria bacterium CG02_land_8_20_14_3_00_40_11]